MAWIVIEGPDGVGKTTLISLLRGSLTEKGIKVCVTSEPTNSPLGKLIREWLLKQKIEPPHVYALAFSADRYYHYHNVIKPALSRGEVLLQERYKESTIVYQGAMGLDLEWLELICRYLPDPDLTILLDLEVGKIIQRLKLRGESGDIFEKKDFLHRVRELYLRRAREKGFLVLYAEDLEKLHRQALQYILTLLEEKGLTRRR